VLVRFSESTSVYWSIYEEGGRCINEENTSMPILVVSTEKRVCSPVHYVSVKEEET
jgi:hypothetical protein